MNKTQERNQNFQKIPNSEEIKEMREHFVIELRRKKRNKAVQKKRLFELIQEDDTEQNNESFIELRRILKEMKTCSDLNQFSFLLLEYKKFSSMIQDFSLYFDLDQVLVQKFFMVLTSDSLNAQKVALWILINEFHHSGKSIDFFMKCGVLEVLYRVLLNTINLDIVDHCLWVIGNIVSEGVYYRDCVTNNLVLYEVIKLCNNDDTEVKRQAIWVLFSICCQLPQPPLAVAFCIFNVVQTGLDSEDSLTIENSAWIGFYLSSSYKQILENILTPSLLLQILNLLDKPETEILIPILKILGNISSGTDKQSTDIVQFGFLNKLWTQLANPILKIKKEVLFILENILASTEDSALKILTSKSFSQVLDYLSHPECQIKKHSVICICNATYQKSKAVFTRLKKLSILTHLTNLLETRDEQILFESLKALKNLFSLSKLYHGEENHLIFIQNFENLSGPETLSVLSSHSSRRISEESLKILHEFFEFESFASSQDLVLN